MFGENEAFSTHYWGPTTLICLLPPSVTPGLVPVTIKESRFSSQLNSPSAGVASSMGDEASGMHSSPSHQEVDFVDSILNTDIVMFNYRDGEFFFFFFFFFSLSFVLLSECFSDHIPLQLDTDKELMELALQIVGMKLTGRTEDAKQVIFFFSSFFFFFFFFFHC